MSLLIFLLFIAFVIVSSLGITRLFLAPLVGAMRKSRTQPTQYFIADMLQFVLMLGMLVSVLHGLVDERTTFLILTAFLFVLMSVIWIEACYVLSRLSILDFWPRAVGFSCILTAIISGIGLALSFVPAMTMVLHGSPRPIATWLLGFLISMALSCLGVAYILQNSTPSEAEE